MRALLENGRCRAVDSNSLSSSVHPPKEFVDGFTEQFHVEARTIVMFRYHRTVRGRCSYAVCYPGKPSSYITTKPVLSPVRVTCISRAYIPAPKIIITK